MMIQKVNHQVFVITSSNTLTNFLNYFTDTFTGKLVIKLLLNIQLYLKPENVGMPSVMVALPCTTDAKLL